MTRNLMRTLLSEAQRYRAKIAIKRVASAFLSATANRFAEPAPAVTVFIANANNRYALQLTIESLLKHTTYPNLQVWVGDNHSTDGSVEYLESIRSRIRLKVIQPDRDRSHTEWLDWAYRNIETPYWVGMDNDVYFLGSDWLADLISTIDRDPLLYIVGGERCGYTSDYIEPYSNGHVRLAERFSAYLFIMRTALRDKVDTSFEFVMDPAILPDVLNLCYDTGGKLQASAEREGLKCEYMPGWYRYKWHHIGSLSWVFNHDVDEATRHFKRYQLQDIKRRVVTGKI